MDFYDPTRPELIPAGTHACRYFDGQYAATRQAAAGGETARYDTSVLYGTW